MIRGQAGEHRAIQALAREHQPLLAGLREQAVTKSVTARRRAPGNPLPGRCGRYDQEARTRSTAGRMRSR
ncbi:MAG TPA: hypothetical protein VGF32_01105, partial [Streptosporangiaceae bacterium]